MDKEQIEKDRKRGIKFSNNGKTLRKYPDDLNDEVYVIPDGVTEIGPGAFNNAQVRQLTFPATLKTIGAEAFMCAQNLEEAILPEGLTEIGAAAFWCADVKTVSLPRSLRDVGEFAFYGCQSLKKLVTFWDEPHRDTMEWRDNISDAQSGEGEAPVSVFYNLRVFGNCPRVTDVTGCKSLVKLVKEYQRRSANILPEDRSENWRDYRSLDD